MVSSTAKLIATSTDIDGEENYPQGCCFSPDGLCVLTATVGDSSLRLYNILGQKETRNSDDGNDSNGAENVQEKPIAVQDWQAALSSKGGETVRSYDWYPFMKSTDPASCCFLATSRDQPIHLFDAYTGEIRATYRPFNALDEMESPTVAQFTPCGQKIMASGFRTDRTIHVFDAATPGRESTVLHLGKTRRSTDGQKGLVSAICFPSSQSSGSGFCVGTYSPGSIYFYDDRTGQQPSGTILTGLSVVGHGKNHCRKKRRFVSIDRGSSEVDEEGEDMFSAAKVKWFQTRTQGGVTQLLFAPNNEYILYSASRRSNAVIAWDLRMLSGNAEYQSNPVRGLASYATDSNTNQRLEFDVNETGQRLYVGGQDRCVRIYDVASGKLIERIEGLHDAVNGVSFSFHSETKGSFLAIASGSRHFPSEFDFDQNRISPSPEEQAPGRLSLYRLPKTSSGV